jgi:hypothetical protein
MKRLNKLLFSFYFLFFILFAVYSYAFLDVGLTLTSWPPYLYLQKQLQYFGYFNRSLSTIIFTILSLLLFTAYYLLFYSLKKEKVSLKTITLFGVLIMGTMVLAYPAFSYDIFNYIFNAKMVLVYHADPHRVAAWNFPDPMLGFMRNVHTVAPYFYGWTAISLIPYVLGIGRIFPELISFKIFSAILFLMTAFMLNKILVKLRLANKAQRLILFLLNPFILIEAIGVGHNDFAMMLPALLSFYFLIKYKEAKQIKSLIFALCFLLFSISTKYASVVLLPAILVWFYQQDFDFGLWGAVILFLVPFSRPLDQLHSWYFIWPLTLMCLAKNIKWFYLAVFISAFALLRYIPYIWYGNWDPPVNLLRLLIYFVVPLLGLGSLLIKKKLAKT